eukprot:1012129-Prymnesium_polylepis.1
MAILRPAPPASRSQSAAAAWRAAGCAWRAGGTRSCSVQAARTSDRPRLRSATPPGCSGAHSVARASARRGSSGGWRSPSRGGRTRAARAAAACRGASTWGRERQQPAQIGLPNKMSRGSGGRCVGLELQRRCGQRGGAQRRRAQLETRKWRRCAYSESWRRAARGSELRAEVRLQ